MKVIAQYSHNGGLEYIQKHFAKELEQVISAIEAVDISKHKTKQTKEVGSKFQKGQMLYSPVSMNKAIYEGLSKHDWEPVRIVVSSDLARGKGKHKGFREMDGIKNKLGLEIQFGKYAFMGYDIFGKMPIFKKKGLIVAGIEVVPAKELAIGHMSTGVSYFEQIVSDLEERGVSDLDVPTLILAIGFKNPPSKDEITNLEFEIDEL